MPAGICFRAVIDTSKIFSNFKSLTLGCVNYRLHLVLNILFSILVYCITLFAQPHLAAESFAYGQTSQITTTKAFTKAEWSARIHISIESLFIRDSGTPSRVSSKPWQFFGGPFGHVPSLAFCFESQTKYLQSLVYSFPPFRPSPLQYYEILLI